MFDELEQDALSEIINMGIGQAAVVLSELAGESVILSVPTCVIEKRDMVIERLSGVVKSEVNAIRQTFDGPFSGQSLLMFPEEKSLELVKLVLGDLAVGSMVNELEQDALKEVGNVIMTSCLGTMADVFDVHLQNTLPDVLNGSLSDVLKICSGQSIEIDGDAESVNILLIEVDFQLSKSSVKGYVVLLFGLPAIKQLSQLVKSYLRNAGLID